MAANIEIKVRCPDLEQAEQKAKDLPAIFSGQDRQTDTFYRVSEGRLKLRESELYGCVLIPYLRSDSQGPRQSEYALIQITENSAAVKNLLDAILGIRKVVHKKRTIYLYENVRIHLDRVEHLGSFMEFEAVLKNGQDAEQNHNKVEWLLKYFGLSKDDYVRQAYVDLLP